MTMRQRFRATMAEARALRGDPRWRVEYQIAKRVAAHYLAYLRKPTTEWEPKE